MNPTKTRARDYRAQIKKVEPKRSWHNDTTAARLVRCADCFGMKVKDVVKHHDLLGYFKLDPEELDQDVIDDANAIDHQWESSIARTVRKLNPEPVAPTTNESLRRRSSAPSEGPKKVREKVERDEWGSRAGSGSYDLNKSILKGGCRSAEEMAEETGLSLSRCKAHVKHLVGEGLIKGDADKFKLIK